MLIVKKLLTKILTEIFAFEARFIFGVDQILFAVNASGNPYIRWVNGTNCYQIIVNTSGITYQTSTNSGTSWTTRWSNH